MGLILTCVTHSSGGYSHEQVTKNHIQISKIVFTQPLPEGVISIGSGSASAHAAAYALVKNTELSARDIVEKS